MARAGVAPAEYRRFLGQVGLGALIPGVGLIAAGRKVQGWFLLGLFVLGGIGAAAYAVQAGRSGLVRMGSDTDWLTVIAPGLLALALVWLLTAVVSLYLLQPPGLRGAQRLTAALVVMVVASLVVTPISFGSWYAFTQLSLIDNVFADDDQHSLTIPEDATDENPWAGEPRVNVLILGSDAGADRDGIRTDTIMVASIDTTSGDTALFSLPRNLQYTPFPEEGPFREVYPDGYRGPEEEAYYWLSAMYRNVPVEFPDYFEGIADPGAEVMKLVVGEALGLDISYYVMVNLRGFQYLVDALGGVDLDVPYRIPIGTREVYGGCSQESGWIEPGEDQHLDGYHALWFARARCGPGPVSNDYERMRRQRCVIGAIAAQAEPLNLLTRYRQLASAAEKTMSTDIPSERLSDFADLALEVQKAGIRSLPFTNEIIDYYDPDYDLVRQFVQDSLRPPEHSPSPSSTPSDKETPSDEDDETPSDDESSSDEDTPSDDETPEDEETSSDEEESQEDGEDAQEDGEQGEPDAEATPGESATPTEAEGAQSIDDVC